MFPSFFMELIALLLGNQQGCFIVANYIVKHALATLLVDKFRVFSSKSAVELL